MPDLKATAGSGCCERSGILFLFDHSIPNRNIPMGFKPGQVVKLKTGSPEMIFDSYPTETNILGQSKVNVEKSVCIWFEKETLRRETFPTNGLYLADPVDIIRS